MDSNQIRQTFTDFFVERGHVLRPSASLIPTDPTLLLTAAGMVPFKPYFLGEEPAPWPRATTVQKCVRTVDIDIIGTTTRHFSFFEMMGNFSFGDYFKESAIPWAHELVTARYGLDPARLWFTVHDTDNEAAQIWIDTVGVDPNRVQRGGDEENFWQMGVPGPCGPDSEIFYDKGPEFGPDGGPIGGGEERFVEVCNLVFIQNVQDRPYHVVGELPAKNIDTGMGLERMAAILQDVPTVFQVDTVWPILTAASSYAGRSYGQDEQTDVSLRLLADHGRAVTFLIGDGVVPSNEGRGHVLRRILRRAVRHAWQLRPDDTRQLVFPALVEATIDVMAAAYPELRSRRDLILEAVTREEERFRHTIASGIDLLDRELDSLTDEVLPGDVAFKLHDTYGFPVELTAEIAGERGVTVDEEGFEVEMDAQRTRARAAWKGGAGAGADVYRAIADDLGLTRFTGYEREQDQGRVVAILRHGESVAALNSGEHGEVFVDQTPFYAESGGQVGDRGNLITETGGAVVVDTQHAVQGLHSHQVEVTTGSVAVGQEVELSIDSPRREGIRKSHTGTHVLHWALRTVLGDHATQAGSLVENGRLRFDFANFSALSDEEVAEVEWQANRRLIANDGVSTTVTSKDAAQEMGALAFFGDKYGDRVRVVKIGDYSVEFCGGTHTHTAGQVGPLLLMSESSIGSNIRRVDALTGEEAYKRLAQLRQSLGSVGRLLKVAPEKVPERVEALVARIDEMEDRLRATAAEQRSDLAAELAGAAEEVGDHRLVVADAGELAPGDLRQLVLDVRGRLAGSAIVVAGSRHGGKGALVAAVTPDLVAVGVSAGELAAQGASHLGGGGSRDPELAQAGGPDGAGLESALDAVRTAASRRLRDGAG